MNQNFETNPSAFNNFGTIHNDNDPMPHGPGAPDVVTFGIGDTIDFGGVPAFGGRGVYKPIILPEGFYNFTVKRAELSDYIPSGPTSKIPPCNKIDLRLVVTDKDGNMVNIFDTLFLARGLKKDWAIRKLHDFYASIGVISADSPSLKLTLDITNRTGRAKIVVDEYNGKKRNKVAFYTPLDPKDPPEGVNLGSNINLPF